MSTQSELSSVQWDWGDNKVHPAIQYPSTWMTNVQDDADNDPAIAMVDSFNPRIVTPKDPIHSLNDYNQGFVSKPAEYYVDITCKPFGDGYKLLLACQNGDRYFDIILVPLNETQAASVGLNGSAWAPKYEVYKGCKVTNLSERYAMGTAPTVTFTCRALRFALEEGNNQREFGNGKLGRTYETIPGLENSGVPPPP